METGKGCPFWAPPFLFLRLPMRQYPMHEVVPKVVAMAVRMVMAMCRIFCQMLLVSIVSCLVMSYEL